MREKLATIGSIGVAALVVLMLVGSAGAGPLARPHLQGGAPLLVSYQGQVTLGGTPHDGHGYFKFALLDENGEICWANAELGEGEPTAWVPLDVTRGLFNALLGDESVENMAPLEVDAFLGTERYLRVWFSPDGETSYLLGPDRRLAAVPYSVQAQEAANADTVDGYEGAWLEESGEIDADIAAHAAVENAHHERYTDFEAWLAVLDWDGPGSDLYAGRAAQLDRVTAPADTAVVVPDDAQPGGEMGGRHTSVTIGTDGLALISAITESNELTVAHCEDATCSLATFYTLAEAAPCEDEGHNTSVTIGADGQGLISYIGGNSSLHIAHCGDSTCSDTRVEITDLGEPAFATSVTIGGDGLGLISFVDWVHSLSVAHCDDTACSSATLFTLDYDVGMYSTSITTGADGLGLISYYDADNDALKVAHCDDTDCSSATFYSLPPLTGDGIYSSATIAADGLGLISYSGYPSGLLVAHCRNLACSALDWNIALDTSGDVGRYNSITVGATGLPLVSYYDTTNSALKMAHCGDASCSSASYHTHHILDADGTVGQYSSVTIGADGLPLISYFDDEPNFDLKVVHCSNALCAPYFRRR